MKKLICFLLLLCFTVVLVTSCGGVKFDISFVVDGTTYDQITTGGKEIVVMPEDPEKEGYTFKGWYWDEGTWENPFTANSLLDAPLTSNMSVYAYFVENGANANDTVTLKFNTMGGSLIDMQTITRGSKPAEPDIPEFEGYYFCGWYLYPDFQTPFAFDQPLTSNTTIYAKWAQAGQTPFAVNDYEDIVKIERNVSFYDVFKEEETGRYFVVFKLGTMRNIIMGRVTTQSFYNVGGSTLSWEKSYGWEESISKSVENSISCALTISMEVEVGVEAYGVSASVKEGFSTTLEASTSVAYGNTRSIMSQASQGGSQSLDGFERGRYYDMFVVGNQNVYQYFIYDANGNLEGSAVTAAEISSGMMPLSSENAIFSYENIPTIEPLEAPDFSLVFASGLGTSSAPYYIDTPEQLFAVGFCPDANYKLASDIDLSEFKIWDPIGKNAAKAFSGVFDGCGKTIKNLNLSYTGTSLSEQKTYGIFGYASGQIKNLKLSNITIDVSSNHDGGAWIYAGSLCGRLSGGVSNVSATGCNVTIHRDKSASGIIAGHSSGTIQGCEVTNSSIFVNGDGGLVAGYAEGAFFSNNNVSGCELNYYAVNANRSNGGTVGYMQSSTVEKCNVSNTKFILAGSDGSLHNYFLGLHSNCALQPSMGYVVGTSVSSTFNADSCKVSGNSIVYKSDENLVGNTSKNESKSWFRQYGGKVGSVR